MGRLSLNTGLVQQRGPAGCWRTIVPPHFSLAKALPAERLDGRRAMASRLAGLSKSLHELRIHLCQSSPASEGVRDFVKTMYVDLKKANPGFPILVREAEGVAPRLIARYAMGQERAVGVSGLNKEQVTAELEKLIANKA